MPSPTSPQAAAYAPGYPRQIELTHACGHSYHYRVHSPEYRRQVSAVARFTLCQLCADQGDVICDRCAVSHVCQGRKEIQPLGPKDPRGCPTFVPRGSTTCSAPRARQPHNI